MQRNGQLFGGFGIFLLKLPLPFVEYLLNFFFVVETEEFDNRVGSVTRQNAPAGIAHQTVNAIASLSQYRSYFGALQDTVVAIFLFVFFSFLFSVCPGFFQSGIGWIFFFFF